MEAAMLSMIHRWRHSFTCSRAQLLVSESCHISQEGATPNTEQMRLGCSVLREGGCGATLSTTQHNLWVADSGTPLPLPSNNLSTQTGKQLEGEWSYQPGISLKSQIVAFDWQPARFIGGLSFEQMTQTNQGYIVKWFNGQNWPWANSGFNNLSCPYSVTFLRFLQLSVVCTVEISAVREVIQCQRFRKRVRNGL